MSGSVVVIGGSSGLGKAVAAHYAAQGREVYVTSRDQQRAEATAEEIGGNTKGIAVDISRPAEIAPALASIGPVQYLVIAAIERDENTIRDYSVDRAVNLATLKLVGYPEVIHALCDRFTEDAAVVLFGGLAKDRPYPGSTMVSTVNGGISTLIHTLALELAPIRFNAIHRRSWATPRTGRRSLPKCSRHPTHPTERWSPPPTWSACRSCSRTRA